MRIQMVPLGLLLAACSGTPTEVQLGQEFELVAGQSVRLAATGAMLTFEAVPEDSRCPTDVVCVWAGNAQVRLRLQSGGQDLTATLNTTTEPHSATVGSFRIQLHGLTPVPRVGTPVPPTQYRARLSVSGA